MRKTLLLPPLLAVFAACRCGAAEFRITALTPEYILVQGDCSSDENAAFFADPRFEESKKAGPDWKVVRKRLELHEDIVKKVRGPFAESMKAIPGVVAYWPEANGMKHYSAPDGDHFNMKAGEVIHNVFVKVAPMKKGTAVRLGAAGTFTDPAEAERWLSVVQSRFPECRTYYNPLSCSIACHVSVDSIGIGVSCALEESAAVLRTAS